jgi:hypothetical protein
MRHFVVLPYMHSESLQDQQVGMMCITGAQHVSLGVHNSIALKVPLFALTRALGSVSIEQKLCRQSAPSKLASLAPARSALEVASCLAACCCCCGACMQRCVDLVTAELEASRAADPDSAATQAWASQLQFAEAHRGVVAKWGRFPHRNALLGRQSTPEEEAGLADGSIGRW